MKKLILFLIVIIALVGCGKKETDKNVGPEDTDNTTDVGKDSSKGEDYPFEYNGVTIHMNELATETLDALGEPLDYFEAASCAFQGLDKIYYYNGFELSTYPMEDKDYISSIVFADDSVATVKGICLGSELEEVIATYGEDYKEDLGLYTYISGDSELTFLIEDNMVSSISYMAVIK